MFEKLVIKGFQNQKKRIVIFDPLMTVLVGKSDAGKSAILRALRWVCLNKTPKNHINWDADYASVTLYVDGHKITRKQGQGINCYILDGEVLKSFNKGVPDSVRNILNVDSNNFQRQLDPPFWIALPAPQVTKELNDIVDLSIIDQSLTKVGSLVRKKKSEVELTRERLKESKRNSQELAWVEEALADFKRLEALQERLKTTQYDADTVDSLVGDIQNIKRHRGMIDNQLAELEPLLEKAAIVDKLNEEVELIEKDISEVSNMETQLCQLNEQIGKIERRLAKVKRCPVCKTPIRLSQ